MCTVGCRVMALLHEHDVKLVELALAALFMGPPDTAVIAFCGLTGNAWLSRRYEPAVVYWVPSECASLKRNRYPKKGPRLT